MGQFFIGVGMAGSGAYLLTSQVTVSTSYWTLWGYNSFGLSLLPLLFGIGLLFFKETLKKSENAPMARCKSLIFLDPESAKRNFSDGVSRFRRSWLEVEMAVLPTDVGSGGG